MRTLRSIAGGDEAGEYAKMNEKDIAEHVHEIGINEKATLCIPANFLSTLHLLCYTSGETYL